jgi:Ni/Fe-hydrogenase subunit HybB-like protein
VLFGLFSLGWRGDARHWIRFERAYYLLAALATPLVVSVHSVVSMDFAVAIVPGWHSTIFPPYFVAGALYSGFAMVLTIAIPLRKFYHLEDFVTMRHINNMAKLMLASGLVVAYGYSMELFMAWYSGGIFEQYAAFNRAFGSYGVFYAAQLAFNVFIPQLLWFRRVRSNTVLLFFLALIINVGMWLERFVIVVQSLSRDYMPSAWGLYSPTVWDVATFAGTIGLFFALMFLFIRFLPMISISEMRGLLMQTEEQEPVAGPARPAGAPAQAPAE